MRVFRGREPTIAADREASTGLLEVAADGERAVRVWTPHRQLAFGRRDRQQDGYDRARDAAAELGFPPIERDVGGRAVAYDGETAIAFARAEPIDDFRRETGERYEHLAADIADALVSLSGVDRNRLTHDEPENAFCPGTHSLSTAVEDGRLRKVAGLAQRVRQDAAITAGILLVDGRTELLTVLEVVYDALAIPFDPDSVGTVAVAGGPSDPDVVRRTVEETLVGDAEPTVEPAGNLLEDSSKHD
ncbi:lipoyl protein ligase domain-containing protein [Natronobacterium gregoryi]|uniref:Biotin/lipoate A/B protein ligase n=2 Tax=Natronobacterium gregoryi TaxID=44930 RepID=L0AEZ9_NATGS|nr:lipoate--protein ligase family protein [Natronobacterium gregoryi]AFZ72498.1 lipoate-protein ligase A [Natronobacterium gregoryi SP2]ELY74370.1 biotin/lipoate A/B protein ligase [Natronobacterium gregoryi SP2]PLK21469.1 lipoate--protein ligase family protein [Natronobacterium gregoryi SP2]SFI77111.1 Lipoate-protein ligase A [Natronobacterium gregoryi]